MIQLAGTMAGNGRRVVEMRGDVFALSDQLRESAAREVEEALDGVSCKRIKAAGVPGAGVQFLSRIQHGDAGNPLFRLGSLFVMGRMLGIPKSRFQRLIDRLQAWLDEAYADAPAPSVKEVLERDAELDPKDEFLRFKAAAGCPVARAQFLDEKRSQYAYLPTVILALESAQ